MITFAHILPCLHVLGQGYMYGMQYPLTYLHVLAQKYCTYNKGVLFYVRMTDKIILKIMIKLY